MLLMEVVPVADSLTANGLCGQRTWQSSLVWDGANSCGCSSLFMCLSESRCVHGQPPGLYGDSPHVVAPLPPRWCCSLQLTPVYVGPAVAEEFKRIVRDSEITK